MSYFKKTENIIQNVYVIGVIDFVLKSPLVTVFEALIPYPNFAY